MWLSLEELTDIMKRGLHEPGSVNFENCTKEPIEIPLFQNYGLVCYGVEDDPSGFESGGSEYLKREIGRITFRKNSNSKLWEIEFNSIEQARRIKELEDALHQIKIWFDKQKKDEKIKQDGPGRTTGRQKNRKNLPKP